MKTWVCTVCGYTVEAETAPAECPICHAKADKFKEQAEELAWASEHVIGVSEGAPEDVIEFLRSDFQGECSEVGMYLAMSRAAYREGYAEIGEYFRRAAFEEAEHAAKYAELLGEVVTASSKKNLELRVAAENGACAGKTAMAKKCKALNLDALHDSIHEMARDEARHGQAFAGLLKRYFG
ncbi:MAG: NADH peroxidase [Lachnospiraceae bacterium]|nr:NADH peroxidase [Lachnospiraceae bacterium]